LQPESHGPVVHEADLHVGAEPAAFDADTLSRERDEPTEQPLALRRRRSAGEARPQAARRVGGEGELRHGEELARHVLERQVHPALAVGEDAVADDALGEAPRLGIAVAPLHADERQESRSYGRYFGARDGDARVRHPLDQGDQATMSGISRARRR